MNFNWIGKHIDTLMVLATLAGGFVWLNSKFYDTEQKINYEIRRVEDRLLSIERDVSTIKTVLFMKGILPNEYASNSTLSQSTQE